MPDDIYEYLAHSYAPRDGAEQNVLLFVAPAADIRSWAGVPRKAFDYQHGFQRTLNDGRVNDVARFFRESKRNVSPTSIVVSFTGPVALEATGAPVNGITPVKVTITVPRYSEMSIEDLAAAAIETLRGRLGDEVVRIEDNLGDSVDIAVRLQADDTVDESFGIDAGDNGSASAEGLDPAVRDRSFLGEFYAQLRGYQEQLIPWPEEQPLREILYSLLRPAIIVDGQHRVFGGATAEPDMRFAVCALPDSSWADSVYQFVVINQKAKPIKPAFLSSIIATSLNPTEIGEVYDRLRSSNIDVERAEIMERVNSDPDSPFYQMIDFEVEGAPGFLQFPGMARLVRDFLNIPRTRPVLLPNGDWDDTIEGGAIPQFFAFWWGIRDYFETADPRLWSEPSGDNPNRLFMIVTLQEMQGLTLDSWADSRSFKLGLLEDARRQAAAFWDEFPATFFTDEWRQKGLQTSSGREILRSAMLATRRNQGAKNWGHRRLKLFQD
jgi:hypothetical protein